MVEVEGLLMIIDELVIVPYVGTGIVPVGETVSAPKAILPELAVVYEEVAK